MAHTIRFCTSADGVRLAFGMHGSGPPLVRVATWLTHLQYDWDSPLWRHWLDGLAEGRTVLRYDERGSGLSDRDVTRFSVDWHIERGNAGDLRLDGLNVALAVHSPGHMARVPWTVALYLDERADGKQSDALTRIFTGQVGGHPERLAAHIGDVLGISSVAIGFAADGRRRSLRIADVGSVQIEAMEGQGGEPVTVTAHPLCIASGYPAVVARSKQLSYHDHGLDWELSEKNGFFSPFATRPDR